MKATRPVMQIVRILALGCVIASPLSSVAAGATIPHLYTSGTDSSGYVDVQVYDASKPQNGPIQTLRGLTATATGMAVDQAGNLYVSQSNPNQPAVVFAPGKTSPSLTLLDPLENREETTNPVAPGGDIAVGKDGTVYVEMCCAEGLGGGGSSAQSGVFVYKKGEAKPSAFLTNNYLPEGMLEPQCNLGGGLAVDAKGDVFIGCNGIPGGFGGYFGVGRVFEFPAGSTKPIDIGLRIAGEWPGCAALCLNGASHDPNFTGGILDLQFDAKGNLVVLASSDGEFGNAIFVYSPNTPRPSQIIPLNAYAPNAYWDQRSRFQFDATKTHIFINHVVSTSGAEVDEDAYPSGNHIATFGKGILGVAAFTISPPPALP